MGSIPSSRVGAGSSHAKDFKNRSDPCLHGTQDEGGTTKHNWSAWCQYNVTGWVSMWANWVPILQIGTSSHRCGHRPCGVKQLAKSMTLCSLERAH